MQAMRQELLCGHENRDMDSTADRAGGICAAKAEESAATEAARSAVCPLNSWRKTASGNAYATPNAAELDGFLRWLLG